MKLVIDCDFFIFEMSIEKSYIYSLTQKYRLAVAIAVLKEKPVESTVEDYIEELKKSITQPEADLDLTTICSDDFEIDDNDDNINGRPFNDIINENNDNFNDRFLENINIAAERHNEVFNDAITKHKHFNDIEHRNNNDITGNTGRFINEIDSDVCDVRIDDDIISNNGNNDNEINDNEINESDRLFNDVIFENGRLVNDGVCLTQEVNCNMNTCSQNSEALLKDYKSVFGNLENSRRNYDNATMVEGEYHYSLSEVSQSIIAKKHIKNYEISTNNDLNNDNDFNNVENVINESILPVDDVILTQLDTNEGNLVNTARDVDTYYDSQATEIYSLRGFSENYPHISQSQSTQLVLNDKFIKTKCNKIVGNKVAIMKELDKVDQSLAKNVTHSQNNIMILNERLPKAQSNKTIGYKVATTLEIDEVDKSLANNVTHSQNDKMILNERIPKAKSNKIIGNKATTMELDEVDKSLANNVTHSQNDKMILNERLPKEKSNKIIGNKATTMELDEVDKRLANNVTHSQNDKMILNERLPKEKSNKTIGNKATTMELDEVDKSLANNVTHSQNDKMILNERLPKANSNKVIGNKATTMELDEVDNSLSNNVTHSQNVKIILNERLPKAKSNKVIGNKAATMELDEVDKSLANNVTYSQNDKMILNERLPKANSNKVIGNKVTTLELDEVDNSLANNVTHSQNVKMILNERLPKAKSNKVSTTIELNKVDTYLSSNVTQTHNNRIISNDTLINPMHNYNKTQEDNKSTKNTEITQKCDENNENVLANNLFIEDEHAITSVLPEEHIESNLILMRQQNSMNIQTLPQDYRIYENNPKLVEENNESVEINERNDIIYNPNEIVSFKVIEELNKVKNYLNRRQERRVSNDGSIDSGYKSESQRSNFRNSLQMTGNWLNQSAHTLYEYITHCPLLAATQEIVNEVAQVLGQLVDKLHFEEKYPSFLEELLEYVEILIHDILRGNNESDGLLQKDEIAQRLILLNKSVHIQEYSIEKICLTLENIHFNLTDRDNVYEITNTDEIENVPYIFHILEVVLKVYIENKKDPCEENTNSQNELKRSCISDVWRKKWNPSCNESNESDTPRKCVLLKCNEILNKLIISCMEGYSLLAFSALQCFNMLQYK